MPPTRSSTASVERDFIVCVVRARDGEAELEFGAGLVELAEQQVRLAPNAAQGRTVERRTPGRGLACERVRRELERTLGLAGQERGLDGERRQSRGCRWRPRSPRSPPGPGRGDQPPVRRRLVGPRSGRGASSRSRRRPGSRRPARSAARPRTAARLRRAGPGWRGSRRCCWCRTRRRRRCRSARAGRGPRSYHSIARPSRRCRTRTTPRLFAAVPGRRGPRAPRRLRGPPTVWVARSARPRSVQAQSRTRSACASASRSPAAVASAIAASHHFSDSRGAPWAWRIAANITSSWARALRRRGAG